MKKSIMFFTMLLVLCSFTFAESLSFMLDGNAHVFSYNNFKKVHKMNTTKYSANSLYLEYDNLRTVCGNNELLFDQKRKTEFANQLITISGYVTQVRKSIYGEYIVELKTTKSLFSDIGVVYPKRISNAMLNELMTLKAGDYFEAIAITRDTCMYVDIPVWNSNGTYRTEL